MGGSSAASLRSWVVGGGGEDVSSDVVSHLTFSAVVALGGRREVGRKEGRSASSDSLDPSRLVSSFLRVSRRGERKEDKEERKGAEDARG